jgi:hypothetical protein
VLPHESEQVSTRHVREDQYCVCLPVDDLKEWHDMRFTGKIKHDLNLSPDVIGQVLLYNLLVAHALKTVQKLGLDVPCNQSNAYHAASDYLTDLVVAYLRFDLLLRVFSCFFVSFYF